MSVGQTTGKDFVDHSNESKDSPGGIDHHPFSGFTFNFGPNNSPFVKNAQDWVSDSQSSSTSFKLERTPGESQVCKLFSTPAIIADVPVISNRTALFHSGIPLKSKPPLRLLPPVLRDPYFPLFSNVARLKSLLLIRVPPQKPQAHLLPPTFRLPRSKKLNCPIHPILLRLKQRHFQQTLSLCQCILSHLIMQLTVLFTPNSPPKPVSLPKSFLFPTTMLHFPTPNSWHGRDKRFSSCRSS